MESGKPIAPQIEDTKDNDAERQDKLKAFKEVQLERCKDMFLLVHQRPEFFDEWFWGSSIVAVEDGGVICLGCGDFAMCSPGSMAVVEAHLIRKHKRRDTSASVDGVVMPSRSQPDGFRMPASYDECPTAEKVLDVALTSQEVLTAWRFHTQSAYGYAGAMRSVAAGVLCRSVFDGDPMVREPAAKGLVARRPKMIKPKVAGTGGFVDDGLIDGIRLPGKNDLHNKQWHVKEMVRWYDVSRAKAEELYSNGVRQGWPGSSLLGEDYKFTTWDMCCMVCYQQRGRVVHSVSAPSMDSHLSGREHKKSLDCMGDGSPNNNNYSSSSTVIVPVVKANTAAITVVDKDELPPAGDPHQKEWHVAQMVKWYEESVEGASALYDAGVRQGWPGCKLLGDAYCPSEWEMICYVCFSQSEKVAKGMHPDTMRQHLGGKAHKNNVMWSKGEWQGGSGSRGGGGENKGSYMGGLTWAAPARPHKARLEQYLAGERLKQQPVVSPERALPEEESRQAAESMNAERNACESFRQHAGECSQCSRYPHATVNCWYFTDHFDGDGCKDCLMLLFRTRSKRPLPESSSSKSSSSELTPPLPLSPRRRTHAGIAATKAARVDGGGGQMGSGGQWQPTLQRTTNYNHHHHHTYRHHNNYAYQNASTTPGTMISLAGSNIPPPPPRAPPPPYEEAPTQNIYGGSFPVVDDRYSRRGSSAFGKGYRDGEMYPQAAGNSHQYRNHHKHVHQRTVQYDDYSPESGGVSPWPHSGRDGGTPHNYAPPPSPPPARMPSSRNDLYPRRGITSLQHQQGPPSKPPPSRAFTNSDPIFAKADSSSTGSGELL